MQDDSAEEEARWKGAIEELEGKGYVEALSYKREVFSVTREGFAEAKELKTYRPDIDTTRDPEEYLIDKVETEIVELTRQEMTVLDYLKKHHGDGTGMKETRMSPEVLSICVQSLLAKGKIIEDDSPNGGYKIVE